MCKKITRTHYYYGSKEDFEKAINGMRHIKGLEEQGVNDTLIRWYIHPETCKIIRLVDLQQSILRPDQYIWTETIYDPNSTTGFSKGHKVVKIGNKAYALHRIVALTFVPNAYPAEKSIVAHKNGHKRDCRASNLIWLSRKEYTDYRKNSHLPIRLNIRRINNEERR